MSHVLGKVTEAQTLLARLALFATLCLAPLGASNLAWALVAVPPLSGHVVDQTALLTGAQKDALEKSLIALEAAKGSQLAVLIVPTTAPEAIEPYALRVAETWKLGRNKVDDGAILVVARDDRTVRIEVGYGLEGALNDAIAQRIISETIVPHFQRQDFAGGVEAGMGQMVRVVNGEPLPAPNGAAPRASSGLRALEQFAPVLFVGALALGAALRAVMGKVPRSMVTGALVGGAAWWLMGAMSVALLSGAVALVLTLMGSGALRLGLAAFYGGGGSGGSAGGFRGGGGGFGGGGASGRW